MKDTIITKQPKLYALLFLATSLVSAASITRCFAQTQGFEESLSIFRNPDNQEKRPLKPNQKTKPTASAQKVPVGNCGEGEWAQCDYDGINN
ncbi:MAG: hypothetical protein ACKOEW_09080 [Methylocystis sp.]